MKTDLEALKDAVREMQAHIEDQRAYSYIQESSVDAVQSAEAELASLRLQLAGAKLLLENFEVCWDCDVLGECENALKWKAVYDKAEVELTAARAVIKQLSTLMVYLEYPYLESLVRAYDEVTK